MTAPRQAHALFTEEEYWYSEEGSLVRHEYFQGEVLALPGNSPQHNDVVGNTSSALLSQLRGKPCRARAIDQRIKVEATTLQTYPDVVVVCPPFRFDPDNQITLLDATVIVEVLSDSTRRYDQNEKFENYKQLPSLRHYLLVETDRVSVEHCFLDRNSDWQTQTFTALDDVITLDAIVCTLSLSAVYQEIEFSSENQLN